MLNKWEIEIWCSVYYFIKSWFFIDFDFKTFNGHYFVANKPNTVYYNEQTTYMWCTVHTRDICINSRRGKVQVGDTKV